MHIKTFFKNLKKRASGSVETAIKVLTAVVLGAAILMGLYGLITGVVLPSTETAVNSMFAYSAEANGGSGTGEPVTPPAATEVTFTVKQWSWMGYESEYPNIEDLFEAHPELAVTCTRTVPAGTTWREWIENGDKGDLRIEINPYEGDMFSILAGISTCYSEIPNDLDTPIVAGTYRVADC